MPAFPTIILRRDFLSAAGSGQKFITRHLIVQYRQREDAHPAGVVVSRFGFTVTKKLGNAVARNRIKRRLREAVRMSALPLAKAGHDYVLIARHGAGSVDFSQLKGDIEFAFSRIHAKKVP